jgi:hypothetical protein
MAPKPGLRDNGVSPPCLYQSGQIRNLPAIAIDAVQT